MAATKSRLSAIDLLRGLVIVLMVLDHVRDYVCITREHNPLDLATTTPALFATRWITHFCAPTFVFLAGVSAWLQTSSRRAALPRFLLTRGLWLVLLELTVVSVGWQYWRPSTVMLQVIWAIGVSMIALAAVCRLPPNVVLGLGLGILLLHNASDPLIPADFGALAPLWRGLHEGGELTRAPVRIFFAYPVLPWFGIMFTGFGFGRLLGVPEPRRTKLMTLLGLGVCLAFVVLRAVDRYGDPGHWHAQDATWKTVGDFLDVQKYPPSLAYALMTLGPSILALAWLDRVGPAARALLLPFGRAPLFAYVVHIYLVHGIALLLGVAMGVPLAGMINPLFEPSAEASRWGLSLLATYGVWLVVVALLYLPVRWFSALKARRHDWWLSYL